MTSCPSLTPSSDRANWTSPARTTRSATVPSTPTRADCRSFSTARYRVAGGNQIAGIAGCCGCVASGHIAQNCFLNCLLPAEASSAIGFYIDEIEMEILRASRTSEFSHNLCREPTSVRLFDNLVGGHLQSERHGKAEYLRGLEIGNRLHDQASVHVSPRGLIPTPHICRWTRVPSLARQHDK